MSKARELLKKCLGTFQTINVWDDCLIKEIIELLAQPEQEQEVYAKGYAEAMRQQVYEAFETGRKDPQKREPIEDGELEVWYSQHAWAMDKQEYMWGFRDAEKAHGITGVDDE